MGVWLSKLFSGKKEVKIALVGLDGVGKTTILYQFKLQIIVSTIPTIGFNVETVEYNNTRFIIWDFTGQHRYKIRDLWKIYFQNTQAVIYVVDSTDRDRIDEAKDELHTMLNQDILQDAAVLVFANKQDRPNAMKAHEIIQKLQLHKLSQIHWHIESTCATSGEGLYEGLHWLSNTLDMLIESR